MPKTLSGLFPARCGGVFPGSHYGVVAYGVHVDVIVYPLEVFGDARVHAGVASHPAAVSERYNPHGSPASIVIQHQRPSGVTLTGVLAALRQACAHELGRDASPEWVASEL